MKVEQVSEHIYSLRSWTLLPVHVWVVVHDDEVTLVDTGFSFMAKGILQFLDRLNAGPLRRIVLTHGHVDHVGSVNKIVQSREVPVYAHRKELPYMNGELPYPHRRKPEHNISRGLAQPLVEDETGNLVKVAGLRPYFTPGHSPGHVVYYHEEDDVLLAGDLFNSKHGKLHRPMFTADMDMVEVLRSSRIVKDLAPQRLEVCHGKPVLNPADQLEHYVLTTAASLSIPLDALEVKQ